MCNERLRKGKCKAEPLYADNVERAVHYAMERKAAGVFSELVGIWDKISFDEKRRLTDTLAETIYACKGRIVIKWRA